MLPFLSEYGDMAVVFSKINLISSITKEKHNSKSKVKLASRSSSSQNTAHQALWDFHKLCFFSAFAYFFLCFCGTGV
jgi:hypothetical protein